MAKLAPSDLAQVLSKLPKQNFSENIVVGYENSDDAGVFRLNKDLALVQTVDFFTPVADDPYIYGQIAAVNSLNDVYAMGGEPLSALSLVCFPQKGDWQDLEKILLGGQETMNREGVVVIGGHSVDDQEIKFGYAVTGRVHPEKVIKNSGARVGNQLVLTKPIGTGVINTAIKYNKANDQQVSAAIETMTTSAASASRAMIKYEASACTDITGFGLLGHVYEMAKASEKTLKLNSDAVPLLPGVIDLIEQKMLTRGDKNNRLYVGETVMFKNVSAQMQSALFDPQTAGGLLVSLAPEYVEPFISEIAGAKIIGQVEEFSGKLIEVE